jgi:alkyl sulfatase BDS1-like metallo-beta-lactamase superfamily hydrolase
MYGMGLARGPRGHVDTGLGKAPARGTIGFPVPTDVVDRTPQPMEIDGVRFVFSTFRTPRPPPSSPSTSRT